MYKGVMRWDDEFEGEVSENMMQAVDPNALALIHLLLSYLDPNDKLVSLCIGKEQ